MKEVSKGKILIFFSVIVFTILIGYVTAVTIKNSGGAINVVPASFGSYRTGEGQIGIAGPGSGYFFARRSLNSMPETRTPGDEYAWYADSSGKANLWISPSTNAVTITPQGNVGIGTTTPQTKFDVEGSARIQASLEASSLQADIFVLKSTSSVNIDSSCTATDYGKIVKCTKTQNGETYSSICSCVRNGAAGWSYKSLAALS